MVSADDLRRAALALEGTSDAPHFDRAAFRARRIYVTLAADGLTANFKFTPEEQAMKRRLQPEAFAAVPGGFGRQGWTTAALAKLDQADLEAALVTAHADAIARPARAGVDGQVPGAKPKRS